MQSARHRELESLMLHGMVTLASLSAAAEATHAIRQRRRGIDPSTQEHASVAATYLLESIEELRELLIRLRLITMYGRDEPVVARLARAFDTAMLRSRCAALLGRAHQRLMSLYPDVSEETVEQARVLSKAFREYGDDAAEGDEETHRNIDAALDLCNEIESCLRA